MFKRFIAFTTSLILVFSITGCALRTDVIFRASEPEVTYRVEEVVSIPIEKPRTLNPLLSKDEDTYHISKLVYEGLFEFDENLIPKSVLVNNYSYNDKHTELEIKLKKNIKWHDGEVLTAKDVKFTIDALISLARTGNTIYNTHVSNIKSAKTSDDKPYDLTIVFYDEVGSGIENLTFPILPSHKFKNANSLKSSSSDFDMVGTGKYKCEKYYDLSNLTLVPNEAYREEAPKNTLNFQILPSREYATNMSETGDISLFFEKSISRDTILSKHDLQISNFLSNEVELIGFNLDNKDLSQRILRHALAYSIDTESILSNYYYKNGQIADSLYFPGYYDSIDRGDNYPYDITKSVELLEKAEYKDLDEDGYRENAEGDPIKLRFLVNAESQERLSAAKSIKAEFDKIGIEILLDICENETYYDKLSRGDFDLYIGGFKIDERYDLRPILHSSQANIVGYNNPVIDENLTKLASGIEKKERQERIAIVKDIIIEELPYYCMFYKTYGCFKSEYFDGEIVSMFNNIYKGCDMWQCKYPEKNFENQ